MGTTRASRTRDLRDLTKEEIAERINRTEAVLIRLEKAISGLPGRSGMKMEERAGLAPYVFASAPNFTSTLEEGLNRQPDLYSDLNEDRELLHLRNREAALWQKLRGICGTLHAISHDNFLVSQSEATRIGMEILDRLDHESTSPHVPVDVQRKRSYGVFTARLILQRVWDSFRGGRPEAKEHLGKTARRLLQIETQRRFRSHLRGFALRLKKAGGDLGNRDLPPNSSG